MALPDSFKYIDGSSFIFAFDTEWPASPTLGWSATVDAEIDLGGLAAAGFRQSAKCDLTANRDPIYEMMMTVEMETDPAAGEVIRVYAGFSDSATAGTGNPGNLVGTDSAYAGYTGGTAANGVKNLYPVGFLQLDALNDLDDVQVGHVGYFVAPRRYMAIVVENASGAAIHATADETAIQVRGITRQIQD
jgi:hypothetical protein